jgi:hypothetical protein
LDRTVPAGVLYKVAIAGRWETGMIKARRLEEEFK